MTGKQDPESIPPTIRVEDQAKSAAYQGLGKMRVDTTDNSWERGVFGGQEDTTQAVSSEPCETEAVLKNIKRSPRPEGEQEPEVEEVSLIFPLIVAAVGLGLAGIVVALVVT